jgi:hypothetical protein
MGEKGKKERAQKAQLAEKIKKDAGQLSQHSDKPSASNNPPAYETSYPPTTGPADTNGQKRTTRQPTKGILQKPTACTSVSAHRNLPHLRSTSIATSFGPITGVSTKGSHTMTASINAESVLETHPPRQTAVAAQALFQQVLTSADEDSDASGEPQSDSLAEFDEDDESLGSENDQGHFDIEVGNVVVAPSGQLNLVAPKQKQVVALAQVDSEDWEDDEDNEGESPLFVCASLVYLAYVGYRAF